MIWYYIILFVTSLLSIVFSWLPQVTELPTILDVDLDYYLTLAVSSFNSFVGAYWPLYSVFQGVLVYLGYLTIKMVLRFFLGHRAPD